MFSATADTNIYISGLHFGGLPRRFLNLAEAGIFQLAISEDILAEIARGLAYQKIGWPPQQIEKTLRQLRRFTKQIRPTETLQIVTADPSDNRILECAAASRSQYLVTGDDHLLRLQRYGETQILTVAEFLELLPKEPGAPRSRQ